MDAIKEQLNPEQIEALVHASQRLLQLQQEPDSPDAIATLPQLKRTDLAQNRLHRYGSNPHK